jgi:hypothetical protein
MGQIGTWHNAEILRDIGTISALRAAQKDPTPNYPWPTEDSWQKNFEASTIFSFLMSNILTPEDSNE